MQSIVLICPGKMDSNFRKIFDEYHKRCTNKVILKEFAIKEELPRKRIEAESSHIINQIESFKSRFVVLLNINGKLVTSEEFTQIIIDSKDNSIKNLIFIIGGSYGVNQNVKNLSNIQISFGRNTWPHNLTKIMVIEQIFRAQTIEDGREYHH